MPDTYGQSSEALLRLMNQLRQKYSARSIGT
jgi:hypothetical protein